MVKQARRLLKSPRFGFRCSGPVLPLFTRKLPSTDCPAIAAFARTLGEDAAGEQVRQQDAVFGRHGQFGLPANLLDGQWLAADGIVQPLLNGGEESSRWRYFDLADLR